MIQQRQAVHKTQSVNGAGQGQDEEPAAGREGRDDYLDEVRTDHLGLVGGSPALAALRELIRRVADSARPVLICGPTGSGKTLVAEAIAGLAGGGPQGYHLGNHDQNVRSLTRVSCREVDEKSLEQLLFGTDRQPGLLGAPETSTLVLEDVDALPEGLQGRVVRLLQSGIFKAVGSSVERRVSPRIVGVTSRSLPRCVRENTFRADLMYELGLLTVSVPGLDERREDIPALVNHFLRLAGSPNRLAPDAVSILMNRNWTGGVGELRHLVERALILTRDQTADAVIGAEIIRALCAPEPMDDAIESSLVSLAERLLDLPIGNKLAAVEAALLESAMRASRGNKSAAARLLGLHRKAVERKLEKYELRFGVELRPPEAEPGATVTRRDGTPGLRAVRDGELIGAPVRATLHLQT